MAEKLSIKGNMLKPWDWEQQHIYSQLYWNYFSLTKTDLVRNSIISCCIMYVLLMLYNYYYVTVVISEESQTHLLLFCLCTSTLVLNTNNESYDWANVTFSNCIFDSHDIKNHWDTSPGKASASWHFVWLPQWQLHSR